MIELKPIKEWSGEHREETPATGGIWIYCGKLRCGYIEPIEGTEDQLYSFHSTVRYFIDDISEANAVCMEDIKIHIEASLKELANKFVKTKTFNK